ncbi:MAG: aminotransferase class IV [Desulfovibrio sp.]|nr:aminotransferase class IV [Desulfovibrio sp.]
MSQNPPALSRAEQIAKILDTPRPGEENILAYYEHRLGAVSREPRLMLLPLDDHLAHRGDGIFETIKYEFGRLYGLDQHLERMRRSAAGIFLEPPCSWERLRELIIGTAAAGGSATGQMRVLLGRGPGGFGVDPAECPDASLYIIAYRFEPKPASWYAAGLKAFRSSIPAKQGYLARIKNANYLPNVLMMRETRERGLDVPISFDGQGHIAESAVANIGLVDRAGVLEVPESGNSLAGTTMQRALELAEGVIPYRARPLAEDDIFAASEVLLLGTGPDCAAVVEYEGKTIGAGREGPVCARLRAMIRADIPVSGVPVPGLVT